MPTFPRHPLSKALAALIAGFCATQVYADVYFSEYIEGSSNNKALEIYNSGNSEVDLASYKVERSTVFTRATLIARLTMTRW